MYTSTFDEDYYFEASLECRLQSSNLSLWDWIGDVAPLVNSSPMKASTPNGNNEGVNILMHALLEYATSPIAATLVSNRVMNLWNVALVAKGSSRQEEATHVEGVVDATPPIFPPHGIARTENVEYDSNLPLQVVMNLNCNVPSSERGSTDVARVTRSTPNPLIRPLVHQGLHPTIDKKKSMAQLHKLFNLC